MAAVDLVIVFILGAAYGVACAMWLAKQRDDATHPPLRAPIDPTVIVPPPAPSGVALGPVSTENGVSYCDTCGRAFANKGELKCGWCLRAFDRCIDAPCYDRQRRRK
jgi:hypothetical protein